MESRSGTTALAGRDTELAELTGALERAAAGRPAAVLIGGDAGIGKTRLLGALADRARAAGAQVLIGRCIGMESEAIPLLPVADALAEPDAPAHGARAADLAERLLERAGEATVLFAIEDAHWADPSTLDVLVYLLRRLDAERMLVVVTFRGDELGRHQGLRRFLADAACVSITRRIELKPLSRAATRAQLEGILGAPPRPALADAIFARAEGNPLFVEELAALPGAVASDTLPLRLRDMLEARLGRLGPTAAEVVRTVAAGGRRVPHALLAEAAALDERELTEALREAVGKQVLDGDGDAYVFRHALLQETAYGQLLPGERARLHATFADALERDFEITSGDAARAAAIARHREAAGEHERALPAAVQAGLAADALRAPVEAADHFIHALALWDAVPGAPERAGIDLATLCERAATAAGAGGRYAEAVALAGRALALVDTAAEPVRAGLLHERRGWFMWYSGRGGECEPDYLEALRLVPAEPPSEERALVLAGHGLMLMLTGRPAEARSRCEEAIAVARAVGADAQEAAALVALGCALDPLGERENAIEQLRRGHELARASGAHDVALRAAINRSHVLRRAGRHAEAIAVGSAGAADGARATIDSDGCAFCLANAAEAAFELGRWDLTDRITTDALDRGATGLGRVAVLGQRAALDLARGDVAAAAARLAEQRALSAAGTTEMLTEFAELDATAAIWTGDPRAALEHAVEGAATTAASDPLLHAKLAATGARAAADLAALARAGRDPAAAARAVERARALRDAAAAGAAAAGQPALAATIAAELARAQARSDAALWDAAARAWEARESPYPAAYARWRQAEALLAAPGGRAPASAALRAAHTVAEGLGARPLADEIEALARRARIELTAAAPAPAPVADDLGLTPREREVLGQLALGRTNRQIAGELFISVKTAGVHVSHILAKLDVANRGEAAAAARRLGLV